MWEWPLILFIVSIRTRQCGPTSHHGGTDNYLSLQRVWVIFCCQFQNQPPGITGMPHARLFQNAKKSNSCENTQAWNSFQNLIMLFNCYCQKSIGSLNLSKYERMLICMQYMHWLDQNKGFPRIYYSFSINPTLRWHWHFSCNFILNTFASAWPIDFASWKL